MNEFLRRFLFLRLFGQKLLLGTRRTKPSCVNNGILPISPLLSYSSLIKGPRKIPLLTAQALVEYFNEPIWYRPGIKQEDLT